MRKTFLYSFVGLVGIGSVVGCGTVRTARDASCVDAGRCSQRVTTRMDSPRPSASSETIQRTQVKGGVSWWGKNLTQPWNAVKEISVENPTANLLQGTDNAPSLPEVGRTSKRLDLPTIDTLTEEDAIIQRESTAKKRVTIDAGQTPRIEPIVVVPEVAIPMVTEFVPTKEKAIPIKTVDVQYGQAKDFTELTGRLQQFRKSWRLRYADIAQEDPYGGVVILDGGSELNQLRDGQRVRVTGVLVPPEARTSSATYRAKTIEILD